MNKKSREQRISEIKENSYDILIIGGGATGLGCALDASSRGLRSLIVEQSDFGKGTSSKSTKLLHGGVRYLEQGNITLVREALQERGLLFKNAGHLVKKKQFILPVYSYWKKYYYWIGLKIYDFLSGRKSLGPSQMISKQQTIEALGNIKTDKLQGGVVFYDGQFNDAGFLISLLKSNLELGGDALNYCRCESLIKNESGLIEGVELSDQLSGTSFRVNADVVVNATGVFIDKLIKEDEGELGFVIKPSQGTHIVVDGSFLKDKGLLIPKTSDGRILFAIPWMGKVLIGTTDEAIEKVGLDPKPMKKEIDFIIETCQQYLSKVPTKNDILSVFAGIRPLVVPKGNTLGTKHLSRSHKVHYSKSGLISIMGGKWTSYRRMAEDTINAYYKYKKLSKVSSKTSQMHLYQDADNPIDIFVHADYDSAFLEAAVSYAVQNEMCVSIDDFLARRCRLLFLDVKKAMSLAPAVNEILITCQTKTSAQGQKDLQEFLTLCIDYQIGN